MPRGCSARRCTTRFNSTSTLQLYRPTLFLTVDQAVSWLGAIPGPLRPQRFQCLRAEPFYSSECLPCTFCIWPRDELSLSLYILYWYMCVATRGSLTDHPITYIAYFDPVGIQYSWTTAASRRRGNIVNLSKQYIHTRVWFLRLSPPLLRPIFVGS